MSFKVIAYYNQVTKITFQTPDQEDLIFEEYEAAKYFVNELKSLGTYDRYSIQIISVGYELMLPSSTTSQNEKKYLYSYY